MTEASRRPTSLLEILAANAAVLVAYVLASRVGVLLGIPIGRVQPVWPAAGVALGAVLLLGPRIAPGIWLGVIASRVVRVVLLVGWEAVPQAALVGLGTATASLAEALLAAWLFRRFGRARGPVDTARAVTWFMGPAAVAGAATGALLGVATLVVAGLVPPAGAAFAWFTWFMANWNGILVVVPLMLAWWPGPWHPPRRRRLLEALGVGALLVGASALTFAGLLPEQVDYPLAFTPMPFLVWAAYRFLRRGATLGLLTVVLFAAWGTAHGFGPFTAAGTLASSLVLLQLYVVTLAVTTLALVTAVSERRQVEAELIEAKARAEEADAVKADFIRMASHELRSPLMPLRLLVDQGRVLDAHGKSPGPKVFDRMDRQVGRLTELLDALLDVSRIERGDLLVNRVRTDLGELVARVVDDFRQQLPGRTLELSRPAAPVLVELDPGRVEQVVSNFVENARKYSPEGSPIWVRVETAGEVARVSVTDEGAGIPAQEQARLFTRFYRAGENGRGREGLGLGLYISRRIVELHGGNIGVDSAPGRGSTFYFTLPRAARAARPVQPA